MRDIERRKQPLGSADSAAIEAFIERIWSEQGLADNTLASYRRDLEGFARWLSARGERIL